MAAALWSGILLTMARGRRRRLFAPTLVLLALVGTWTGHTLEYVRVAGGAGLRAELLGSVHAYMLPMGSLLLALSVAGGVGWWRAWQALGRRLDALRAALAASLSGHPSAAPPATAAPSEPAGWAALALLLAGLQLGLYLLQENLEAALAGTPMPGAGAVLGAHTLAPLVHLAVATLLAALMAGGGRALRRRAARITGVARLLRVLLASLAPTAAPAAPAVAWCPSPLDRLGRQLWSRPPPTALPAR
jgi:hypothetical protein